MFEERHQNNFEYKPATCGICAYFIAYFLFCNCQDSHKVPRKFKNVATFCEGNSNPASINCILKVMNKLLLCLSCGTKVFSFNLPQVFGCNKNFRVTIWWNYVKWGETKLDFYLWPFDQDFGWYPRPPSTLSTVEGDDV